MFASTHNPQCLDFTVIGVNISNLALGLIEKSTHVVWKWTPLWGFLTLINLSYKANLYIKFILGIIISYSFR